MTDFTQAISSAVKQLSGIPDSDKWPLSERLTAFFFMLLDELDEIQAVEGGKALAERFSEEAAGFGSPFHAALQEALITVARAPDVSAINRIVTESGPARFVAAEILIQLMQSSLADTSTDRQRSAALADKTIAYAASLWSTPVPQKAVDLVRYAVEAGYVPLQRIPIIADWFGPSTSHVEPVSGDNPLEDTNL